MPKYRATLKKDRTNKDGYQLVMVTYSHLGRIATEFGKAFKEVLPEWITSQ